MPPSSRPLQLCEVRRCPQCIRARGAPPGATRPAFDAADRSTLPPASAWNILISLRNKHSFSFHAAEIQCYLGLKKRPCFHRATAPLNERLCSKRTAISPVSTTHSSHLSLSLSASLSALESRLSEGGPFGSKPRQSHMLLPLNDFRAQLSNWGQDVACTHLLECSCGPR